MIGRPIVRLGMGVATAVVVALSSIVPAGATTASTVLGSGSDTTQFVMSALDTLYQFSPGCDQLALPVSGAVQQLDFSCSSPDPSGTITTENYAHDQVHEAYFLGSSVGVKQLCAAPGPSVAAINYARSSRSNRSSDCTGLHFVAYARDGITWEAFGNHHLTSLTQAQLQSVYITCTAHTWGDLSGKHTDTTPLTIYTPQAGSGTRSQWDLFLGGDSSHCITDPTHIIPENSNVGITAANQADAIFPFSFGVWVTQVANPKSVAKPSSKLKANTGSIAYLGAVDGFPASSTVSAWRSTIQDGSFPYGRFLYNVFCGSSSLTCGTGGAGQATTPTVNYVGEEGWICKAATNHVINPVTGNNYRTDIEATISAYGFVPLTSAVIGGGDTNSDYCRLTVT
jgi:ABC-type phosphate transport system substrate-binding protein